MYSSQIHYLLSDFDSIGYDPFESWILKCAFIVIVNKFFYEGLLWKENLLRKG